MKPFVQLGSDVVLTHRRVCFGFCFREDFFASTLRLTVLPISDLMLHYPVMIKVANEFTYVQCFSAAQCLGKCDTTINAVQRVWSRKAKEHFKKKTARRLTGLINANN